MLLPGRLNCPLLRADTLGRSRVWGMEAIDGIGWNVAQSTFRMNTGIRLRNVIPRQIATNRANNNYAARLSSVNLKSLKSRSGSGFSTHNTSIQHILVVLFFWIDFVLGCGMPINHLSNQPMMLSSRSMRCQGSPERDSSVFPAKYHHRRRALQPLQRSK